MPKNICVMGLGHVGLPLACTLAISGFQVTGVDTNPNVLKSIQSNKLLSPEPGLQSLLTAALDSGLFKTSNQPKPAEVHVIAVPTPLSAGNSPDLSFLFAAIDALCSVLRCHDLVLIESTCPVGTTERVAQRIAKSCQDVYVAYCPERVLPGNLLYELTYNNRIVGGMDEASTREASKFYSTFIKGQVLNCDARTAEAVKLVENSYRDVNIAYANELSMLCDHLKLNANEVIHLANQHPRVNILQPGAGVGGHCVAVDPWFLISAAPALTPLTSKARQVNLQKTDWVIQKIKNTIQKKDITVVACLGLTYKPNVTDIRESSALKIADELSKEVIVLRVDPFVPNSVALPEALIQAELIVGLVAHDAFLNIPLKNLSGKFLLDFAGIFNELRV